MRIADGEIEFVECCCIRHPSTILTSDKGKDRMQEMLNLDQYPIDRPDTAKFRTLVAECRSAMASGGMFNLTGFVRPAAINQAVSEISSQMNGHSFTHQRQHNVYFKEAVEGLPPDHGALQRFQTVHHTLCGDQLQGTVVHHIYEYLPLAAFLAEVMQKPRLYLMGDPLARVNVIEYRDGETLNWHFDRSQFTVTLLLQSASTGGKFEYRSNLRTDADPNFNGVAALLDGRDLDRQVNPLAAGTLNVFAGKNTLHRVSTVGGPQSRLVVVFSYYDRPHVTFSESERVGFYGRSA